MRALWLLVKLSGRNLWRNPRRTLLTVATISFGLAVLLWVECILEGRNQNIIEKITSSYVGHVQIYDRRFAKDHLLQYTMKANPPRLTELLTPGTVSSKRVHIAALISSGENSATVSFQGIEPGNEAQITSLRDFVVRGSYLPPGEGCTAKQILIGQELGELLGVGVGDKLVMMTQAADGTLGNDAYRVLGLFDSKSPDFNKRYVFGTLDCATTLAALTGFHEIVLRLPDERRSLQVQAELQKQLGSDYKVNTWREALPSMATMIKFNHATLTLLTVILFTVISLGIVNTLLMSVFERTREFGVMLALGTSPLQLGLIITFESLFLGVISALLATLLGSAVLLYHGHVGFDLTPFLGEAHAVNDFNLDMRIYPVIQFDAYLHNVAITLTVVLGAALYPAYRAARLNPVESLRHT